MKVTFLIPGLYGQRLFSEMLHLVVQDASKGCLRKEGYRRRYVLG